MVGSRVLLRRDSKREELETKVGILYPGAGYLCTPVVFEFEVPLFKGG